MRNTHTNTDTSPTEITIVITPSQCVAQHYQYAHHQQTIHTPNTSCIPLNAWIEQAFMQLNNGNIILTPSRQHLIIQTLLQNHYDREDLANNAAFCRALLTTIDSIKRHAITKSDYNTIPPHLGLSVSDFLRTYDTYLHRHHIIDQTGMAISLIEAYNTQTLPKPSQSVLIGGHAHLPPILQKLLTCIPTTANNCKSHITSPHSNSVYHYTAPNEQAAFHTFLQWSETLPQDARIAYCIPHLKSQRMVIQRLINNIGARFPDIATSIHVNTSTPLIDTAVIQTALSLIHIPDHQIALSEWLNRLQTRGAFSNNLAEQHEGIHHLQKKLSEQECMISLKDFKQVIVAMDNTSTTQQAFCDYITTLQAAPEYCRFTDFLQYCKVIWNSAVWPRQVTQDTSKAINILMQCIYQLSMLPEADIKASWQSHWTRFESCIKKQQIFTTGSLHRIQIIDLHDAAFCAFDHVWCSGLEQDNWPQEHANTSLLTNDIISRYQTDKSAFHIEAEQTLTMLQEQSSSMVLSYAIQKGDKNTLISHAAQLLWAQSTPLSLTTDMITPYDQPTDITLETYISRDTVPLTPQEMKIGTYHLKTFQICHFKSFAQYRLRLKSIDTASLGINAKHKGIILHTVLEQFYNQYPCQTQLQNMRETDIKQLLNVYVQTALKPIQRSKPATLNPPLLASISEQYVNTAYSCIAFDQTRPSFTVTATESPITLSINGMTIHGIIDRIDSLANDTIALIDYKTGISTTNAWFGTEIRDPQLPIYTIAHSDNVSICSFVKLHDTGAQYSGLGAEDCLFKGIKSSYPEQLCDWNAVKSYWHDHIHSITMRYKTGSLITNPDNVNTTCSQCDFTGLCRIWEKENAT